jgi:hypothetical protein
MCPSSESSASATRPLVGDLTPASDRQTHDPPTAASCDYCGSVQLEWRKCKLVFSDCKQINKSCADL